MGHAQIKNDRPGVTGLALSDSLLGGGTRGGVTSAPPWIPFNAAVFGNIDVHGEAGFGVGAYIVGLILPLDQDLGNGGEGFITSIDYDSGRFEVGGTLGVPGTGTIIEINDPLGRFGKAHSPDPRWSVDPDNPTITTGNGFPMGLPRVDPPGADSTDPGGEAGNKGQPLFFMYLL